MEAVSVPLPPDLWQRIQEFADGKRTGQVTLNYLEGQLLSFEVREHVKAKNARDKREK